MKNIFSVCILGTSMAAPWGQILNKMILEGSMDPAAEKILSNVDAALFSPEDRYGLVKYVYEGKNYENYKDLGQRILWTSTGVEEQRRAVGALLGLAIGDALGSPQEFTPVRYGVAPSTSMKAGGSFRLDSGQWTDDTSQALCLADSLLATNIFEPLDFKTRIALWWFGGYNNAFTNRGSVGLGRNSMMALEEFLNTGLAYTKTGDEKTSGNGPLMRLAPVAIRFYNDLETAMRVASMQSRATHRGEEVQELSRLLAAILVWAINGDSKKIILKKIASEFRSSSEGVMDIVRSAGTLSKRLMSRIKRVVSRGREDWDWRRESFRYNEERVQQNPGYIGSYAMDAMAMALHIFARSESFQDAVGTAAAMGGDSDTVAAIVGQMAGALYSAESLPCSWVRSVQKWDDNGNIAAKALQLFDRAVKK